MKIFLNGSKVNFVDDNNVLLGFDYSQCCCEQFGWFIQDTISEEADHTAESEVIPAESYEGWNFDPKWYGGGNDMAVFKIVKDGKEKYLHIYNHHNGYYGHGFEFKEGNEILQQGCL